LKNKIKFPLAQQVRDEYAEFFNFYLWWKGSNFSTYEKPWNPYICNKHNYYTRDRYGLL